jgi:predicted transcriptional regulator
MLLNGVANMSDLRTIRRASGLTQMQLAQKANVSRFRICMAECGSLQLRSEEIEAINKAVKPEIEKTARIASEFERATA